MGIYHHIISMQCLYEEETSIIKLSTILTAHILYLFQNHTNFKFQCRADTKHQMRLVVLYTKITQLNSFVVKIFHIFYTCVTNNSSQSLFPSPIHISYLFCEAYFKCIIYNFVKHTPFTLNKNCNMS